jgi:hypothetical protein
MPVDIEMEEEGKPNEETRQEGGAQYQQKSYPTHEDKGPHGAMVIGAP